MQNLNKPQTAHNPTVGRGVKLADTNMAVVYI